MNCVLESVFVVIVQPNNEKNVILGCLYKPPNVQTEIFNDEIKQVLAKIGFENKLCFLFGDFNINILNADSHVPILIISLISCIPMVSILLSLNQQGSRLIQLL